MALVAKNGSEQDDEEWEDVVEEFDSQCDGLACTSGDLELTLEGQPAGKKRRVQNSSKEARTQATAVHQTHALCLLARGSCYDMAANWVDLQARLLSMLKPELIKQVEDGAAHVSTSGLAHDVSWLAAVVQWFHATFTHEAAASLPTAGSAIQWRAVELGAVSLQEQLQQCVDKRRGDADQLAALLVALLRAFGLVTRTVWHLEAVSVKSVLSDKPHAVPAKLPARSPRNGGIAPVRSRSNAGGNGRGRGRRRSADTELEAVAAAMPRAASAPAGTSTSRRAKSGGADETVKLSSELTNTETAAGSHGTPGSAERGRRTAQEVPAPSGTHSNKRQRQRQTASQSEADGAEIAGVPLHKSASDSQAVLHKQGSNRGQEEFEQHLAMAMAATAFQASRSVQPVANQNGCAAPTTGAAWKRAASLRQAGGTASSSAAAQQDGWVWARRAASVPVLRWAEVHVGNAAAGRWVPVDGLRCFVDQPQRMEQCLPAGSQLQYVVAYQPGLPAKDVTRRYASDYTAVARQRMDEWWRDTLAGRNSGAGHGLAPEHALMLALSGEAVALAPPAKRRKASTSSPPPPADPAGDAAPGLLLHGGGSTTRAAGANQADAEAARLRAAHEEAELERKVAAQRQGIPTTVEGFKNHPLYVLKRHLTKYQALCPAAKVLGLHRGEPYYARSDVHELHTAERWRREGRAVRAEEFGAPAKVVKKREADSKQPSSGKVGSPFQQAPAQPASQGPEPTSELYGFWQTEEWRPEPAVNGKVPKNERGNVEVPPFAKELPAGTVHLDQAGLVPVCKELGVDFAPALLGFEARGGAMVPVIRGVVVCEEHADAVLALHEQKIEQQERKAAAKRWQTAEMAWMQLLQALWMRSKLQRKYSADGDSQPAVTHVLDAAPADCSTAKGCKADDKQEDLTKEPQAPASVQQEQACTEPANATLDWLQMSGDVQEF